MKIRDNEYNLSELGTRKNEIIEELKLLIITILKIWFSRMEITYS